jgi:SAM-dependent methyltransferase
MTPPTTNDVETGRDQFSGSGSSDGYWRSSEADDVMQRGNACVFEAMATAESHVLAGATVLDVGCNMGAFLRYLCTRHAVARAFGLDPAESSVRQARDLSKGLPIEYAAVSSPPSTWADVDVAFSQEVMYLIDDLDAHAADMWRVLRPGGHYVAVTSVHRQSELMAEWHAANQTALRMPPLRGVEDYISPFLARGFRVEVARLHIRAVPIDETVLGRAWELLQFWTATNDKVVFRFYKDGESALGH